MNSPLDGPTSYKSPKLEGHSGSADGHGLVATERIGKGELLVTWGGRVLTRAGFDELPREVRSISLQIDEDLFIAPTRPGPADRVNHSCAPNAGMNSPISLVAMRLILPGEEICYDYAMSDGSDYDEFTCLCGAPECRGRVTGNDWQDPELWRRYRGYFSPYLDRRIRALNRQRARSGSGVCVEAGPLTAG